ncbi:APC amino acid permease [Dichomitus squalens]|nr:APC amino acid permease [Dichomitus squalens]
MNASPPKEKHAANVFEREVPYKGEDLDEAALNDDAALAVLGYRQEFKRGFSPMEIFGLSFSIIGLFPSIASVLVFAIPYGGPVALVWGWATCSFFLVLIALALAELASAAPTSGGLYYWTWAFASPRWRNILAWIVGCEYADTSSLRLTLIYSNSMGLIAGVASIDWGCAVQLMAAVSIGSNETFVPTTAQTYGVFVAVLLCHAVVGSLATHVIALLQNLYTAVNILLCLAIIIALPAATPKEFRNPPSFAFSGFINLYGWPNGFAFVLSFLAPLWTIAGGFDGPVHVSEEASNARTAVPWAIISAVVVSSVLGWIINIVLSLCMGTDMEAIMTNPIGQPMATIIFNSLGRNGTLAVWSIVVIVQFLMGSSSLVAASRQMFAFARDKAIPFSGRISHVNDRTRTPVTAVWASAFVALVIGLIGFAGPIGSSAIFGLSIAGQYTAFSIPVMCRFLGGREWKPGPFTLGRAGVPVGIVAVAWMIFAIVIFAFPSAPGPDAEGMNYMPVVYGAWIGFCLLYYYMPVYGGVYWFNGPRTTIHANRTAHTYTSRSDEDAIPDTSNSVDRPSEKGSAASALSQAHT